MGAPISASLFDRPQPTLEQLLAAGRRVPASALGAAGGAMPPGVMPNANASPSPWAPASYQQIMNAGKWNPQTSQSPWADIGNQYLALGGKMPALPK